MEERNRDWIPIGVIASLLLAAIAIVLVVRFNSVQSDRIVRLTTLEFASVESINNDLADVATRIPAEAQVRSWAEAEAKEVAEGYVSLTDPRIRSDEAVKRLAQDAVDLSSYARTDDVPDVSGLATRKEVGAVAEQAKAAMDAAEVISDRVAALEEKLVEVSRVPITAQPVVTSVVTAPVTMPVTAPVGAPLAPLAEVTLRVWNLKSPEETASHIKVEYYINFMADGGRFLNALVLENGMVHIGTNAITPTIQLNGVPLNLVFDGKSYWYLEDYYDVPTGTVIVLRDYQGRVLVEEELPFEVVHRKLVQWAEVKFAAPSAFTPTPTSTPASTPTPTPVPTRVPTSTIPTLEWMKKAEGQRAAGSESEYYADLVMAVPDGIYRNVGVVFYPKSRTEIFIYSQAGHADAKRFSVTVDGQPFNFNLGPGWGSGPAHMGGKLQVFRDGKLVATGTLPAVR